MVAVVVLTLVLRVTLAILNVALLTPIVLHALVLDALVLLRMVVQVALVLLRALLLVLNVVVTVVLLDAQCSRCCSPLWCPQSCCLQLSSSGRRCTCGAVVSLGRLAVVVVSLGVVMSLELGPPCLMAGSQVSDASCWSWECAEVRGRGAPRGRVG